MDLSEAPVTIPMGVLETLKQERAAALKLAGELEAKLLDAMALDPQGRTLAAVDALRLALPVVQFAVANLDPLGVNGWPWVALRALAVSLPPLKISQDVDQLAKALYEFSKHAEEWDLPYTKKRAKLEDQNRARAPRVLPGAAAAVEAGQVVPVLPAALPPATKPAELKIDPWG